MFSIPHLPSPKISYKLPGDLDMERIVCIRSRRNPHLTAQSYSSHSALRRAAVPERHALYPAVWDLIMKFWKITGI